MSWSSVGILVPTPTNEPWASFRGPPRGATAHSDSVAVAHLNPEHWLNPRRNGGSHRAQYPVRPPRAVVRQAPHHRSERPGRLHPVRAPRLGVRPGARQDPRRQGRPRVRTPARGGPPAPPRRQGLHRPGNAHTHPQTSRRTTPRLAEAIQHRRQLDPLQIERTIANLKTWRILHTDYRRPVTTFSETISTVIALTFYQMAF